MRAVIHGEVRLMLMSQVWFGDVRRGERRRNVSRIFWDRRASRRDRVRQAQALEDVCLEEQYGGGVEADAGVMRSRFDRKGSGTEGASCAVEREYS